MKRTLVAAAALSVCAGLARAQTVEFRIVERKGQTTVTGPHDARLDFAVQARSLGPPNVGIASVGFNIRIFGEPETGGILQRGLICHPDHTYTSAIGVSNTIGQGGLASQYSYLAGINGSFNGSINASTGTFTDTPDQDIGLVTGDSVGNAFLTVPGIDLDRDGNPDGWGSGIGAVPPEVVYASIPPAVMQEYFGGGSSWSDVYRFRYTVTDLAPRTLDVRLERPVGYAFSFAQFNAAAAWGAGLRHQATATASNLLIGIGGPVAGSCCDAAGSCAIALPAACPGKFLGSAVCSPNACAAPIVTTGPCCDPYTRVCSITQWNACTGLFESAQSCDTTYCFYYNPTRACCSPTGQCTIVTAGCPTPFVNSSTCTPNPCPIPIPSGACCRPATGDCVPTLPGACTGLFHSGVACFPSPCTNAPGSCCDLATGQCTLATFTACPGYFLAAAACAPNPCPPPLAAGACCEEGRCTLTLPAACASGVFSGAATCGPSTCQSVAACCDWTTGACVVILSSACVGPPSGASSCTSNPCPVPAAGVHLRIVERAGRSLVTGPGDNQLDLAVQARVVNAAPAVGVAGFAFGVRIVGEPESAGTLARAVISSADHTYSSSFAVGNTVGLAGLASHYAYLAGVNATFNGLINTSGGTFTNGPDQEIGLITGQSAGAAFLNTPGIDADADANPDTWPGSGSGAPPLSNTRALLDPSIGAAYFGAAGRWVDVYRFRYTLSSFAPRSLVFRLGPATTSTFSQAAFNNGQWAPWTSQTILPTTSDLVIGVIDAVPGACCDASGACSITPRAQCAGSFLGAPACTPDTCSTPDPTGACCDASGACSLALSSQCQGEFIGAPSCSPSPCPPGGAPLLCCIGACCRAQACGISTAASCAAAGGGVFRGAGIPCGPDALECCPADFNSVGGVNVQDVIDFVAAWFAGEPRADFNGGGLSVQDIFDFLNAWLTGC
ncbi:MAG TPA: GC-type dockerin domain-anchored protein [Phycisphaerales bacterium]|nr:GC-type dockerin domain-anchored protein [Phycisphaerales bacterium]